MYAVEWDLPRQFVDQQTRSERTPAVGHRPREKCRGPDQSLDILHEVIAAEVRFEILLEMANLARQRCDQRRRGFGEAKAPGGELLHPDDDPQRKRIAVPAVLPALGFVSEIAADPLARQICEERVVDLLEIFHIVQIHPPELTGGVFMPAAPIDIRPRLERLSEKYEQKLVADAL
nr:MULTISPECIES: hypothetical protein [Methylosinus]